MNYTTRLHAAIQLKKTSALVGLDPRFENLPASIVNAAREKGGNELMIKAMAYQSFCCEIIDIVSPLVPAVKPQAAFFEELGPAGCLALGHVIRHARKAGLIVICDAKRGDIGTTAQAYAHAYLAGVDPDAAPWGADALTINPYLGSDTLKPFVDVAVKRQAGLYVLVRTSNPGAATFQDRVQADQKLFESVGDVVEALNVETKGEKDLYGCVGAVIGATYPDELKSLRSRMINTPFLIPGYGSQGGTAEDVRFAFDAQGLGALVNSSRGINFAYEKEPYKSQFGQDQWRQAVEAATIEMIADLAKVNPICD